MRKGNVTAYDIGTGRYRVTFPDHGNVVSPWIVRASHVGGLEIGSTVAVALFAHGMDGAVIMARIEE